MSFRLRYNLNYLMVQNKNLVFVIFYHSDPDAPPRDLNVTPSSNSLRIAWNAPAVLSGPTSYLVQVTSLG